MKRLALTLGGAALAAAFVHSLRHRRSESENVVRRYFDAWSEGDGEAVRDLVTDDYLAHVQTFQGMENRDADELVDIVDGHAKAFAEITFELQELICHNGTAAVRATMRARHGETKREGEIDGIAILRLEDGQIAEEWSSWDYLGLANQLGLAKGG